MTFDVEIVLRDRDYAVTEQLDQPREAAQWTDDDVALRGFSWIVEPAQGGVVIAIEIPSGAAVAGPFAIEQHALDGMIGRVLRAANPKTVVH